MIHPHHFPYFVAVFAVCAVRWPNVSSRSAVSGSPALSGPVLFLILLALRWVPFRRILLRRLLLPGLVPVFSGWFPDWC
jgi:hypothetical protein